MSLIIFTILFLKTLGTLKAYETEIDISRQHHNQKILPKAKNRIFSKDYHLETDDNNDYSNRFTKHLESDHMYVSKDSYLKEYPVIIHQPREDPKLYYQSEAYLNDINGKPVNYEVSHIYPGREVIRADENRLPPVPQLRQLLRNGPEFCIKCPLDRTLVAKPNSDRVKLLNQRLLTCSGRKVPRSLRFIISEGPTFGTLLHHGTHSITGRIVNKNETLQHCTFRVHVIVQSCPTPKYLLSHCGDQKQKHCNFTCRDTKMELQGKRNLVCKKDRRWSGNLPVCKARKWCDPLPPPEYGRIQCKGSTASGSKITENTRCRLRCPVGWRWFPRVVAICRRGSWTSVPKCQRFITDLLQK